MAGTQSLELLQQERDSFREKFEHMKILVKELQQETQTLKIRGKGVETVTQLLQECRHENLILQKQKSILTTAVQNLQNRLASNQLPVEPVCEEGEVIIPGTSKELLDNLARENSRLRSALQNLPSIDPIEKEKQQQFLESLQQKVASLEKERDDLKQANKELEAVLHGSESEKAHQLILCQSKMDLMQRNAQTQDVLCHSLAEEITLLRQNLRKFSRQTLDMEIQLRNFEEAATKERSTPSPSTPSTQDQTDSNILQEENKKLKKSLDEALTNNRRWQEYDRSREKYVQDLKMKNEEVEGRLKKCQTGEINSLLATANQKVNQAQEEIRDLTRKLDAERRWREEKEREVTRLRHQVSINSSCSDEGTLEALRAQVQTCTEDFEMERKDREKAQHRVVELESELERAKTELQMLRHSASTGQLTQQRYQGQPAERGFTATPDYSRYGSPGQLHGPYSLASRGLHAVATDGSLRPSKSNPGLNTRDKDVPMSLPVIQPPQARHGDKSPSDYSCPGCGLSFHEEKHGEFVQHLDECWMQRKVIE